ARRAESSLRSCPAEKTLPSAAITMTWTVRSAAAAVSASPSAAIIASERLLRRSGRARVRRSTLPWSAVTTGDDVETASSGLASLLSAAIPLLLHCCELGRYGNVKLIYSVLDRRPNYGSRQIIVLVTIDIARRPYLTP